MAQARSRNGSSCIDTATMVERCGPLSTTPSADVVYNEIWKPAALPAESFIFGHQALTTPRPTNPSCYPVWQSTCRITIHYQTIGTRAGHIHPLWSVPRPAGGIRSGHRRTYLPRHLHRLSQPHQPRGHDAATAGRDRSSSRTKCPMKMLCNCAPIGNCCSHAMNSSS